MIQLATLTDDQLDSLWRDPAEDADLRGEAALEVARRAAIGRDERHAAFHGRPLRYVRVERRRGYRGEPRCHDCYYRREWDGR